MNKSKYYLLISVLLVIIAALIYSVRQSTNNTTTKHKLNNQHPSQVTANLNQPTSTGRIDGQLSEIFKPSEEIHAFNQYLDKTVSINGTSLNDTMLSELINTINADTIDEAANQLAAVRKDPQKHQLLMRDLFANCYALKTREDGTYDPKMKSMLAAEHLLLALQKSGYCRIIGTMEDPFYLILGLARKGDKLAQLYLIDDLYYAINRGLIKPKLYPLEYNDLRTEVIAYLQQLSGQGVIQATINLQRLYDTSGYLVPQDKVMAYYYAVLAEKQSHKQAIYMYTTDELYERLSEDQKVRADRMTKHLQ